MTIRWIVNPGDFRDVVICSGRFDAADIHASIPGSRLYRCFRQGDTPKGRFCWEQYTTEQGWMTCNRDNLPIKVLEAGEK